MLTKKVKLFFFLNPRMFTIHDCNGYREIITVVEID